MTSRRYKTKSFCSSCKVYKNFDEFYKDSSRPDGCSSYCKGCSTKNGIEHYRKYRETYLKRGVKRRKDGKKLLDSIKGVIGCISCNEKRIPCLDFHHEYPEDKAFSLGACTNKSLEVLKDEVKKCVVICANCHRVLHSDIKNTKLTKGI